MLKTLPPLDSGRFFYGLNIIFIDMELLNEINKMRTMMGLEILSEVEVSIDYLYEKNYSDIDRSTFDKIMDADPRFNGKQPSNFGKWMIKLHRDGQLKDEDVYKIKEYLPIFIKHTAKLQKKDINQYKSLNDIFTAIKPYYETPEDYKSNREIEKSVKENADKVYEDDKWLVIVPRTKEASCYYGKGTQWCTASSDDNYENNMFDHYNDKSELFINIKKGTEEKYQMSFPHSADGSCDIMDATDTPVEGNVIEKIGMTDGLIEFYKERVGWVMELVFENFYESMSLPEEDENGEIEHEGFYYHGETGEMIDKKILGGNKYLMKGFLYKNGEKVAKSPIKYDDISELKGMVTHCPEIGKSKYVFVIDGSYGLYDNKTGLKPKDCNYIDYSSGEEVYEKGGVVYDLNDEPLMTIPENYGKYKVKFFGYLGKGFIKIRFNDNTTHFFRVENGEEVDLEQISGRFFRLGKKVIDIHTGEEIIKNIPSGVDPMDLKILKDKFYKYGDKFYDFNSKEVTKDEVLMSR